MLMQWTSEWQKRRKVRQATIGEAEKDRTGEDGMKIRTEETSRERLREGQECSEAEEVRLERKLSPLNVWALAFGCIIGSGAFLLPGTSFLPKAGPVGAAAAMLAGALIMTVIASNYHYMINKFPVAGGEMTYAGEAFGEKHAFICAWFLSLSYLMIVPFNATALSMVARSFFGRIFQIGFHYEVAGYEIYFGEILLGIFALVLFAFLNIRGVKFAGVFQTILSCALVSTVLIIFSAAAAKGALSAEGFAPFFAGENRSGAFSGVIKVLAVAPFCFLGFDTTAQTAEELRFSEKHTRRIMNLAIFFGAFIYIALNLTAASCRPAGFENWAEYTAAIADGGLRGVENIPTFYAARTLLGLPGLFLIGIAVLSAMCTGITGFYLATSRTLYRMAKSSILPAWFGVLHPKYKTPARTLLFILAISVIAPFFGRTALGWIVDMASLGTAIGYGYTSLAAVRFARREGKRRVMLTGVLGVIFAGIFFLLLVVPIPFFSCSLGKESFLCLFIWTMMGIVFYGWTKRRKREVQ